MGQRFEGRLEEVERGGAVVELPAEVVELLGAKGRVPVRGTLNGVSFESTVLTMGGRRLLGVHKATREAAGASPGQPVAVELEPSDAPRVVEVPPALDQALAGDADARAAFERLSYTHRKEYARWIAEAKREETRGRRLERALAMLRDGVKHP
jgi:hypothetical protein